MNIDSPGNKETKPDSSNVEQDLFELERYINDIWQFLPIPILYLSPIGVILDVNRGLEELLHYPKDELLGRPLNEVFAIHGGKRLLEATLSTSPVKDREVVFNNKEGKELVVSISTFPRRDEKDEIIGYFMAMVDITERKRSEEALKESEARYRLLVDDTLQEGIWVVDAAENTTFVNPKMGEILGYSVDEMKGRHLFSFMDEQGVRICQHYLARRKQGIKERHEFEFIHKDGHRVFVLLETSPVYDEKGNYAGALAGVQDITDQKQVEKLLIESEEQYRLTIDSMPEAIHVVDLELRVSLFNHSFLKWNKELNLTTDVIGHNIFEVFPFLQDKVRDEYRRVIETGEVLITEETTRVGNRDFITETRKVPIFEGGKVTRVVTIIRDIGEHRRDEAQVRAANERLHFLLGATSAVIYTAKPSSDYGATFVSDNVRQMTGYEAREFLEKSNFWLDHVHPEDTPRILSDLPQIFKKRWHSYEYRFLNKSGQYIWVRDEMKLVCDKEGRPLEIVGFWLDITDRMKAEEALRQSEERFRQLAENINEVFWLTDPGRLR